jgi:hypothetical protein
MRHLFPWVVVRHYPNARNMPVGRYRTRSDADGHAAFLKQTLPHAHYSVIWWQMQSGGEEV